MRMTVFGAPQTRFLLVGAVAAGLYFTLVVLLLHLGFGGPLAAVIAYWVAFLFAYYCHRSFTFRSKARHKTTALRYAVLQCLCAITAAFSAAITEGTGLSEPLVIAAVTTGILGLVSYYASSHWVFRK